MHLGSGKDAFATSMAVLVFVALLIGMLGAFYFGQNSVRIVTVTQNYATST